MFRKTHTGIVLTLLIVGIMASAFEFRPIEAQSSTLTVDDDGPADFRRIQDAIDGASSGDNVYVHEGKYFEHLTINKDDLTLAGENPETTIIDGSGEAATIAHITANYVNITGFKLQNSGTGEMALHLDQVHNNTITHNIVEDTFFGFYLEDSYGNTIADNNVSRNSESISLHYSDRNLISQNFVVESTEGIYLQNAFENVVYNNIVSRNIDVGITLDEGSNNLVSNNTITNNKYGIHVAGGNANLIENNTVAINQYGVLLGSAYNNEIYHNSFVHNERQIDSTESDNVWDDGYPSGGNYWSDYSGADDYKGPSQDQSGSDGIGDQPYAIDGGNKDQYPLAKPFLAVESDLGVTVWTPTSVVIGTAITMNVVACNLGMKNHTEINIQLLVEGEIVKSEVVPQLTSGFCYALNYSWSPTAEGSYNITACVIPVSLEYTLIDNVETVWVNAYTTVVGSPRIWLDPPEITIRTGSAFTINVNIANATDLFMWQVSIYYQNTVLEAIDVTEGPFLKAGGPTIWPSVRIKNDYNSTHGHVLAGCTILGSLPGVNGKGILATIAFKATASGATMLKVDSVDTFLGDSALANTFPEAADGYVNAVTGPTWDLNNDGKVDILDLIVAGDAFCSYQGHPRWNPIADVNQDNKVNIIDLALIALNWT